MNYIVTMPKEFVMEIRGFINLFASKCKGCMYRAPENCEDCPSKLAMNLLNRIDSSDYAKIESYFRQYPYVEHLFCTISAIQKAGRPVRLCEIHIPGVSRQKLFKSLKKMCLHGYITRKTSSIGVVYDKGPKNFSAEMSAIQNQTKTNKEN